MKRTALLPGGLLLASVASAALAQSAPKKTLAECLQIAIERHPDIQTARAAADVGHAQTWEAISTALPQINASYSAQKRHTSAGASTGTTIGGKAQTFQFYSTGFTFSQILFDFGQSLYAIRSAQATERSVVFQLRRSSPGSAMGPSSGSGGEAPSSTSRAQRP